MNKHRATNYLISTGHWTKIECEDWTDNAVYFTALDSEDDEVSLKVEIDENDEFAVYELKFYDGGTWELVDLP